MDASLPVLAGMVSTTVFAGSTLPMLNKALRTRELSSYSLGNIALANVGNAVHSVYVFHLPPGPIWLLHTFYMVSSALMLFWFLRFRAVKPYPEHEAPPGGTPKETWHGHTHDRHSCPCDRRRGGAHPGPLASRHRNPGHYVSLGTHRSLM